MKGGDPAMYYEKYLNYLHSSSGWASEKDLRKQPGCLRGQWDKPHAEGGVILSSFGGQVLTDGGRERRHVLTIGSTGSGKSRLLTIPSVIYSLKAIRKDSKVIFDVKGEMEAETRKYAELGRYVIRKIDFRNPEHCDGWSPFVKINNLYQQDGSSRKKAWRLLEELISMVFKDGESKTTDPFWHNISSGIFRAICSAIWENGEHLTFSRIMDMANSIPGDSDEDCESLLFQYIARLPRTSIACRNIEAFHNASNTTRGNVMACFNTYLTPFNSREDIMEMMSGSTSLDFREIGTVPTVLYISLPDDSIALGPLQGLLLTQLMQDLNECALENGGCLPVRTDIYLDELCNIHPAIPSLETALTISRSRGIRYVLAIQSYSQLAGVYGAAAETIAANCATWIALNIAKDETFRDKLSHLCGKNPMGDPLITPSQLSLLQYGEGIVIRERTAPYFAQFEDLSKIKARIEPALRWQAS